MRLNREISGNQRFVLFVSALLLWAGHPALAAQKYDFNPVAAALDRKIFVGLVGDKGNTNGTADEFSFIKGKFHSSACDAFGIGTGSYTAEENNDAITFEAVTESQTDGVMVWQGTVAGDELEGTITWFREDEQRSEHWFKGTLKLAEGSIHNVYDGLFQRAALDIGMDSNVTAKNQVPAFLNGH